MSKECRFCKSKLKTVFADLNAAPLVNNYIKPENLYKDEHFYPLITYVCGKCKLVQTLDFNPSDEIFTQDYAYFSSYSASWLSHCSNYADMICGRLKLDKNSKVMELASNDGYMLQYFKKKGIPHLGIEPCQSVADAAIKKGIDTVVDFFGRKLAKKLPKADLICMCNVLAHVPDINDFTAGIKEALKESGTVTVEFPHLLNIIINNQFDTIYHEHYSYLSLIFIKKLFNRHGLKLYDAEELPTHGGSLRIYGCHLSDSKPVSKNVKRILDTERNFGLEKIETYSKFNEKVRETKRKLLKMLIDLKNKNNTIVAYGAAAKGNTLFNYCGISYDFIDYSVDLNPAKQNTFLPGCHIQVKHPDEIKKTKPDYILITPWNIKEEVMKQLSYAKKWGARFIVAVPEPRILK